MLSLRTTHGLRANEGLPVDAASYNFREMELHKKELPPIGTNAYCLTDSNRGEAIVIDAPEGGFAWASAIAKGAGCKIVALILTHGHWDHMLDAADFDAAGIPILLHEADRELLERPECMRDYTLPGIELRNAKISRWLQAGETLELLGRSMEVRPVPGHCPGNVLIYCAEGKLAFVGDAIFAGSMGRYDLPGGDLDQLEHSIRTQVYTLPEDTVLYSGHGPSTSVGAEKAGNPYVRP